MELKGNKIVLNRSEVSDTCPLQIKWASKMVASYGADHDYKGRLREFARCPVVLTAAGYEVVIKEQEEKYSDKEQ